MGAGRKRRRPILRVDGAGLYVESTAPASKTFALYGPAEDEDANEGAWSSYDGWRCDVLWELDAVGDEGEAGTRALELTGASQGQVCKAIVHLGDMEHAMGVSVDGAAGSEYEAKTYLAATRYIAAMDIRSEFLRAKVWADNGSVFDEPAQWDVQVPIAANADETTDHFSMRLRVGNVTASQRLTVHRLSASPWVGLGDIVAWETVGVADGSNAHVPHRPPLRRRQPRGVGRGAAS